VFRLPVGVAARRPLFVVISATLITIGLSACGTPGSTLGSSSSHSVAEVKPGLTPPILLFTGTGTSASDVSATKALLGANGLTYATANSSQLDGMTESQLAGYRLLLVPGGNSITIGNNLKSSTTTNIHNAVINDGLHYMGVCAGAFFGGYSVHNGLNLTSGVWFNVYPNGGNGTGKTAVEISYPDGPQLDQYWQDGPELDGWGSIVGKYPDGGSAIVEGSSGKGWVLLSGIHAEAPASWRSGMHFTTSVAVDNAYFMTMVTAALAGASLPRF
jgi:hypothetical protein